jgi:hypothetical protein
MNVRESCPYCGKMTDMQLVDGVWKSKTCDCGKDLAALANSVPELIEEKPDLKAKAEVLP